MKINRLYYFLAAIIICFSLFFRLYKLTSNPPALFSDEIDAGYQAFIFNRCGTDYFGNRNPIHFHSLSDWRTSLYIYSIALTQKIVGFNELSVRLPSVIYGVLFSLVLSLIIYEIFHRPFLSLLTMAFATISPWQIHYSRSAFEVSGMLFFLALGIYFWIKYTTGFKLRHLIICLFAFISTAYFYSTAKFFIILLLPLFIIIWPEILKKIRLKHFIVTALFALLLSLPLLIDTVKGRAGYRFSYINIFSDPTVSKNVDYSRFQDAVHNYGQKIGLQPSLFTKILHNKVTLWSSMFIRNYLSAFSTGFLLTKGDSNLRQGFSGKGYLLYPDIFFLLFGLFYIIKSGNKTLKFFLLALLLSPVPFALTRDSSSPHATRLILMSPSLIILTVSGLYYFFLHVKHKKIYAFIIFIAYLLCFIDFIHFYFYHYPEISARSWHAGMKSAVISALGQTQYPRIFFSSNPESFVPFFLFYSRYQPENFPCAPLNSFAWEKDQPIFQSLSKYYFGNIEWPVFLQKYSFSNDTLFVVSESELPSVESGLLQFNRQNSSSHRIIKLLKISKQYTEQEVFYLIDFT